MFNKILIANRGEIACRIIRTARSLGVRTVALFSDADRHAAHVAMADEAFYLGGSAPADSYLRGDAIIDIAKACGAEAIHPGYGFLSENAGFAAACERANIAFIGPKADSIEAMGSKSAAKLIMGRAGVPLVPGYHGDDQSDEVLLSEAEKIGFPLLIKAAFGGGGKGMRIVRSLTEVKSAIDSARREAASSFGNDKLLMERYLEQPRHVEVQVFADTQGNAIYLSDRDCSIQRRHQKVVEEAPAPGLSDALRRRMGEAAVAAARAIDYVGAGTVEFLLDTHATEEDGSFFFMEMNTRLQVEHPVTELVTRTDLVHWQLLVAAGEPLPLTQEQVAINGHAFEVRIYAEDPDNDFLPASGKLNFLREPKPSRHVRIDSGVREGDEISNFYDPMIAKLIVWDESRSRALQRLQRALDDFQLTGLKHNIGFLGKIAAHPAFAGADFSTDFIERYQAQLLPQAKDSALPLPLLAKAALYEMLWRKRDSRAKQANSQDPSSPWGSASGFRLNSAKRHDIALMDDEHHIHHLQLTELAKADSWQLTLDGQTLVIEGDLNTDEAGGDTLRCVVDGHISSQRISRQGMDFTLLGRSGELSACHFRAIQNELEEEQANHADLLKAPMNGTIVTHLVAVGDSVKAGQGLMVMEAMKMEYTIAAPFDGTVSEFFFQPGELVSDGAQLLELSEQLKEA
ncbi:acetyl/propionyl/methylcrotonyl-CoA carboxylase subunit alpha [Shewanella algae]|uniref:acetyl/propionyl/methylcrotonyl-CoA carboxylase subunit alpha n=1 Tax=Shewanella algae TaxID=38313 RepID=UPI001AACB289|nr:acetyl/propionyl/methylcrotonyl-CoA carboxylase subunit alpha [Shewanella algae]MBO2674424.1 acetyl/propionyl/methylcrotonyl-CoA carboxylase subunit alpha [Shewanella algae]